MRVALISWGTEGDIRPFFSLARALKQRGHEVSLDYVSVEGRTFEALARVCDVDAKPLAGEYFRENRELIRKLSAESLKYATPPKQFELIMRDLMDPVAEALLARSMERAEESDVMVAHTLAHPTATAAEKVGRPLALIALQPVFRSKHYPPAGASDAGRFFNPLLWKIADWVMRGVLDPRIAKQRAALGLAPRRFDASHVSPTRRALLAVSPTLFARPDDWAEGIVSTGFLPVPETGEAWAPSPELGAFLDAGAAPIFASFGSMFSLNEDLAHGAVRIFVDAARMTRSRVVIQCPQGAREGVETRDDVRFIDHAPHARLFPRCSMVVHHGGAGTTQSALQAGRASVVVPHAADQFYWGDVLHKRGVAAKPIIRKRLTAKALAERIRYVLDRPALTERAAALSSTLGAEDGPTRTAIEVERMLTKALPAST